MDLKNLAVKTLQRVTGLTSRQIQDVLEVPPDLNLGDLAFPCFVLAKKYKKAPGQIAMELRDKLAVPKGFKKIEIAGPYLNFFYDNTVFAEKILKEALSKKFGRLNQKNVIMMDVYQANPYKSFHIGHIRNAAIGESVRRILEFAGNKTVTASYSGDVGMHVARWLLYYRDIYRGKIPEKNFTKWVGQIYANASEKGKQDKGFAEQAQELNRQLDKGDPELTKLWSKFRKLCYDDYEKIAKELECKIDFWIPESKCVEPGRKWVLDLYKKKKLIKSEGAIGIDLEKYGLGFFLLLKSDGTALYATKDFGLLYNKNKICKNYNVSLYVVASEQELYFKQLFKTYNLLKMSGAQHIHLNHGLVTLKSGKMASRLGNVVLYEDLRDDMTKLALKEVQKRQPKLSKAKQEKIAAAIAFGAMKYDMLKYSVRALIRFDEKQALSLEGNTAPYLQYALVRASKIMKKAKGKPSLTVDFDLLNSRQEQTLLKQISAFPDVVETAAKSYSPHLVANYAYKLAQNFASFYEKCRVVGAPAKEAKARLLLVKAFYETLKKSLCLLGIDEVEVM